MGSTESTLPPMEGEETSENVASSSAASLTGTNIPPVSESTPAALTRRRQSSTEGGSFVDDPWWWEIENENLILDQVPNVTADFSESDNTTVLSDDFTTLLKIGENVNSTLTSHVNKDSVMTTPTEEAVKDAAAEEVVAVRAKPTRLEANVAGGEQSMEEFRAELRVKRLARQSAVHDLREEISTLRSQLATEQELTRHLRRSASGGSGNSECESAASNDADAKSSDEDKGAVAVDVMDCSVATAAEVFMAEEDDDANPMSRGRHANIELANAQLALQLANADNLSLRTELGVVKKQVVTLKEVITCCKQMLAVKEEQCSQLKGKLSEIENSFSEREMKIMSSNLRQEYERQLGNMTQLRQLYEERQRVAAAEHENLQRLISIKKDELLAEQEKTKNFEERNQTLMKEVESANNELVSLREECNEHKFEKKALKEEMGAVNTLFSQMVMGFNGKNNLDIDRLTTMLEENRTLLNDMATKEINCSDGATLPKLLFELVEQATLANPKSTGSRSHSPTLTSTLVDNDADEHAATGDDDKDIDDDVAKTDDCDVDDAAGDDDATGDAVQIENKHVDNSSYKNNELSRETAVAGTTGAIAIAVENGASCVNVRTSVVCSSGSSVSTTSKNPKKQYRKNVPSKFPPPPSSALMSGVAAEYGDGADGGACGGGGAADVGATLKFHEPEVIGKVASAQEIIGNLPKVWKVLMELLSHHKIEHVQFEENGTGEDCYKSVETPNGPKAELSVSKTYIKLKDLILEKKSLVKETNRLKTLNCHLDYRLNEQEKRLSAVSLELTKTWHLVGKMQRQHRQLHTQEQILRYQLQQKRRLLTELKDELEYCRRKWAAARAKNDESQEQYNDLRREFAKRKLEDANNSAESGYSDSGPASDEDERERIRGNVAVTVAATPTATPTAAMASPVVGAGPAIVTGSGRSKHLKEMFEHTRKIKRMQSTSPGRAAAGDCRTAGGDGAGVVAGSEEIVLRWNSAPPTCGWRGDGHGYGYQHRNDDDDLPPRTVMATLSRGAIPKSGAHNSRSKQRERRPNDPECDTMVKDVAEVAATAVDDEIGEDDGEHRTERTTRIQRLEEQCKSLIQQVLETSDNRERLEVQLCQYQDEIAPVQYAVPLDDLTNKKRLDRMTRASSAPAPGSLTPREEEYTRKRSERLERLEEESRQLMSRIKRTSDRGHYLRCSLDRIRRAPSREGSLESSTDEDFNKIDGNKFVANTNSTEATAHCSEALLTAEEVHPVQPVQNPLTAEEEAYTARRAARLQRLEEESKQLLTKLSRNTDRGDKLDSKLDSLHERFSSDGTQDEAADASTLATNDVCLKPTHDCVGMTTIEQRIENIEKISTNRDERLRILEEEGKQLLTRLTNTSERGTQMINRIAEREARHSATSSNEIVKEAAATTDNTSSPTTDKVDGVNVIATATATELMPTPKNVACTSIVGEELTERVTVTTTPSQIAAQKGAIPKTRPTTRPAAQLSAARTRASHKLPKSDESTEKESLEEMVNRLRALPFPPEHNKGLSEDTDTKTYSEDNGK